MSPTDRARDGFRVERLGKGGDGVVSTDHGLVFVLGALPGDLIALGKPRRDGKVQRADLRRVLEAGPERVPAACPIATQCGGCPLMAASAPLSGRYKTSLVRHALDKAGAVTVPVALEAPEPHLGYRVRARLSFVRSQGGLRLGYLAPGTKTVVDAPSCAVLSPPLAGALSWAREALGEVVGSGELHLGLVGEAGAVLSLKSDQAQPSGVYRALEAGVEGGPFAGAELWVGGTSVPTRYGRTDEETEDLDGRRLSVAVGGFRQAHAGAPRLLGQAVIELGRPEGLHVLELHAGHGNFTLALAARARWVEAVELSRDAAPALLANLERHGLSAKVKAVTADALDFLTREARRHKKERPDLVVLDPPRTGAKELVPALGALAAPRIVYVSCAPVTLGRDLAMLTGLGYQVTAARAFDLFPKTTHVEAVVALERRP